MLGDTVVEELTNFDTSSLKMAEPVADGVRMWDLRFLTLSSEKLDLKHGENIFTSY
jgi:hypothetical protein